MNFSPKQQIIINKLKNYYKRATKDKQIELNNLITQYYIDKDDDEINEDEVDENEVDENEVDEEVGNEQILLTDKKTWHMRYPIDDVIRLENYSIEKMLNLYNITLEPYLDDDIIGSWTCEDQLSFSWMYKKVFLKKYLKNHGIIICNSVVQIVMVSIHDKNKKIYPIFQTKYIIIRNNEDVQYFLRDSMIDIKTRIGKFTQKMDSKESSDQVQIHPSGFVDLNIQYEKMNVVKIKNVFATSYIELPARIINTKSCINIKNEDSKCFLYCHLLNERYRKNKFLKIQNPERLYGKKAFIYKDEMINLNYKGIDFPVPFNTFYSVKKIEEQNQIRINIFEYKEGKKNDIAPIYHSKRMEFENCMNLLVICDQSKKKYHYVYIKNLNRLLKSHIPS